MRRTRSTRASSRHITSVTPPQAAGTSARRQIRQGRPTRSALQRTPAAQAGGVGKTFRDLTDVVAELSAQVKVRNLLLNAELRFASVIRAIKRQVGDNPTAPPIEFLAREQVALRKQVHLHRKAVERTITSLVRELPVWPWWQRHRGLGDIGLGLLIGVTGDLHRFPTVAKVWKYLSLHVVNGRAAHAVRGAGAKEQQYVKPRRTLVYKIGNALLSHNRDGEYRKRYLERKAMELERLPEDVKTRKRWAHRRAHRYVEKMLLRDLWREWRAATTQTEVQP